MIAPQGVATTSGIQFGPNRSGKAYISLFIHRGNKRRDKSKWSPAIAALVEYSIFCSADEGNWRDSLGHYWGVRDNGRTVLGCSGELLSKFPRTQNDHDPWHGYPVSPMEGGDKDAPPDEFVERWIGLGVISKTLGRRIERRKV